MGILHASKHCVLVIPEMISPRKICHSVETRALLSLAGCRARPPFNHSDHCGTRHGTKTNGDMATSRASARLASATPAPTAGPDRNEKAVLAIKAAMLISGGRFADLKALRDGRNGGAAERRSGGATERPSSRAAAPRSRGAAEPRRDGKPPSRAANSPPPAPRALHNKHALIKRGVQRQRKMLVLTLVLTVALLFVDRPSTAQRTKKSPAGSVAVAPAPERPAPAAPAAARGCRGAPLRRTHRWRASPPRAALAGGGRRRRRRPLPPLPPVLQPRIAWTFAFGGSAPLFVRTDEM